MSYTLKWRNLGDSLTPNENNQIPDLKVGGEYLPSPNSFPSNSGNYPLTQTSQAGRLFQSVLKEDDPNYPNSARVPTLIVGRGQAGGQLFNPVVLAEIVLPDGTSYKFSYNVNGEIDKVVYPTNAFDKYAYTGYPAIPTQYDADGDEQPYRQSERWLTSRKQSADGTGNDIREWGYSVYKDPDGGGSTAIIAPDNTEIFTTTFTAGPKYADNQARLYYRFGDKDAGVGMVSAKTFYSPLVNGVRTILSRELYQYDSTSTNYTVTCQLGQSPTSTTFPMRRAARLTRLTKVIFD